jgi:hypothetical protein
VKVSLSMMDLSAGQVLLELVKPESPQRQLAEAR